MKDEIYEYNGNLYTVIDSGKLKVDTTGEWTAAVIYTGANGMLYVRSKEDFERKFNLVT